MMTTHAPDARALTRLHPTRRRPAAAIGVVLLALAAAVAAFPRVAPLVVGAAGGWALWLAGALMLGFSLVTLTGALRISGAGAALVAVVAGAALTFNPNVGALATALVLAAALAVDGGFQLAAALQLRPLSVWRWMFASAVCSLAAAILLGAGFPERTADAIAATLAVALATTGAALAALGFTGPAPRRP